MDPSLTDNSLLLRRIRGLVALTALLGIAAQAGSAAGGEWLGFVLNKNMWGAERPRLNCCVCPDDYCPKGQPLVPRLCPSLCPDYCAKPEPYVPFLCPSLCPDYCAKPMPYVPGFICRPGLICGPACQCEGGGANAGHLAKQGEKAAPTATGETGSATTRR
jgi:hypothetical protein